MTEEFGSLLGMAKIVVMKKGSLFESDVDTIRCYLQLDRAWVAPSLREFATRFPSHFVWMGRHHKLLYTGCDLHEKPLYSADHPLERPTASQATSKKSNEQ